jgi:hypothetical protein
MCLIEFAVVVRLILNVVREIAPLSRSQKRDGTGGQWIEEQARADDPVTWDYGFDATPGKLFLPEGFETREIAFATIAHEFGHACTRSKDLDRRGVNINREWISELAADWYACKKWGFAREIRQHRKSRDRNHHGPPPGEVLHFPSNRYRVTRNFCIREISD